MTTPISRRVVLLGAGAAAVLGACSRAARKAAPTATTTAPPATSSSTAAAAPPTAAAGAPARFVDAGPRDRPVVALTFHLSGDATVVSRLLDAVDAARAPITVFAVGQWLEQHPAVGARILAAGHELANHTYTHPSLGQVARATVAGEITRCRDVLTTVAGSDGGWFRASGIDRPTPLILEEAGRAGYRVAVGFDVDPKDFADPGADAVVARTAAATRAGSIISLHFGHAGTVAAYPRVVAGLRAKGLQPVHLRELIGPPR